MAGLALLALAGGCGDSAGTILNRAPRLLVVGEQIQVSFRSAKGPRYSVLLGAEEALHLQVVQQGVDLTLEVFDPHGRKLLIVDGPNGTRGTENLWIVAHQEGTYQIVIRTQEDGGQCELRLVSVALATQKDRWRQSATLALAEGDRFRTTGDARMAGFAEIKYQETIAIWRNLEEPALEAVAWVRLGQLAGNRGDWGRQVESFETAVGLLTMVGHAAQKSYAYLGLGTLRQRQSDPQDAMSDFEMAVHFAREAEDRALEATALSRLAVLYKRTGALERAIELFGEVIARSRDAGRLEWVAGAMVKQAESLALMGRLRAARERLVQAEELSRHLQDKEGSASALVQLGWVAYLRNDFPRAHLRYEEALEVSRSAASQWWEATVLDRRGSLLREEGGFEEAGRDFLASRKIFHDLGNELSVAHSEVNLAWLSLDLGRPERATNLMKPAVEKLRAAGDWDGVVHALFLGARIARQRGDLHAARQQMEELLLEVESQRLVALEETARISYLSLRFVYYEFLVDLLMALEEQEPGQGFAAQALETVERGRARSLLDQLAASGAARQPPTVVSLQQIQDEMLGPGTVLLVYSLGRDRSFVWAVTHSAVTFRTLPAASKLEELAKGLHATLSYGISPEARTQGELAAKALSDQILLPLATTLKEAERVIVMGDGALLLVPFSVLPFPSDDQEFYQRGEFAYIPSSSVVLALRKQKKRMGSGIAVLADPPFTVADSRVASTGAAPVAAAGFANLRRLPYSRYEAEAILALFVGKEPALKALGLAAQKRLVTTGVLDGYRILHFATHGVLHTERPELSGIALSMFDEQGVPIDGTLRVRDVVDLNLQAELVVLSACQTALGEQFKGEGIVGFPRAFMLAGVPRVVVSLWKVHDEATAELMSHFYRAMIQEQLSPAAALARAQSLLAKNPRWRSPHYWAAFVLQGEWR